MITGDSVATGRQSPAGRLEITGNRHGDIAVLHVVGDVDAANADELWGAIAEVLDARAKGPTVVVLELTGVRTFAAAGLHALLAAHQECSGDVELRVVAAATAVLRSLRVTDLDQRLTCYPSLEQALSPDRQDARVERLRVLLDQREQQLASLPIIEQAKGMLMQDFHLTAQEAFDVLRKLSQDSNTKVHTIATRVVGDLAGTASERTADAGRRALAQIRSRLT